MPKVIYEKDGRIGRITLNRPEVMNAIDDDVPVELADCVARANADPGVHIIVLSGAGRAFCAGYDLTHVPAGDLQGARPRCRQRFRYRAMHRHDHYQHRRQDRLHADTRVGLSDNGHVGVPARSRARQAHAVHRR